MSTPTNQAEFLQRFESNTKFTGYGMDTTIGIPCPFCAAADFKTYKILEAQEELPKESICKECGRGIRAIITRKDGGQTTQLRFLQTCGDDQPEWLEPKIPREPVTS